MASEKKNWRAHGVKIIPSAQRSHSFGVSPVSCGIEPLNDFQDCFFVSHSLLWLSGSTESETGGKGRERDQHC